MKKENLFIASIYLEKLSRKLKAEGNSHAQALHEVAEELDSILEEMILSNRENAKITLLPWDEE